MLEITLRGRGPNTMTLASLGEALAELDAHPEAPLLIRGAGRAFSAGLDLDALAGGDPRALTGAIERLVARLYLHPAPTVAAVNGHAVAGGCLVAQACDLRVGVDDPAVKIGMTGVAIGITYPPVVMRLLKHRLPRHTRARVILSAERFSPQEALRVGLLDLLDADAVSAGRAHLARLAAYPQRAYAEAKRALREGALEVSEAERARFDALMAEAWDAAAIDARRADGDRAAEP